MTHANGLSLSALKAELAELKKDLQSFSEAYDILCKRMIESNETPRARRPLLHEWSGSRAVVGSLEMSIHAIERVLHETAHLIERIEAGEIRNTDVPNRPQLGVVDGGKKE